MCKHNFVTLPWEQKYMSISKMLMNQYLYRKCVKDTFYVKVLITCRFNDKILGYHFLVPAEHKAS